MITPQQPIEAAYYFLSDDDIGAHVTQVAIDGRGEFAVMTNSDVPRMIAQLREIADRIEQDLQPVP